MNRQPGEPFGSTAQEHRTTDPAHDSDGLRDQVDQRAHDVADRASGIAEQGRERAAAAAEAGEERAAEGMERAADMVRDRADGTPAAGAAMMAADGMERGAGYLRSHDTNQMWTDVEEYVREHPVMGIAGSVAAGFLVGRMLR